MDWARRLKAGKAGAAQQRYEKVTTNELAGFSIAEEDDSEMTIDQLSAMHTEILKEAESAIASSETSVSWLRDERVQSEQSVRALTEQHPALDGVVPRRGRCASCGCGRSCAIL